MILLKNGFINLNNELVKQDILIENEIIKEIGNIEVKDNYEVIDCTSLYLMPSGIDVHVHLREPGFTHKETIKDGTKSAAKGGFTTILAMPNLNPFPDSVENIKIEEELIKQNALIEVIPYGCITVGEKDEKLADIIKLKNHTRYFTDDGRGVNNLELLREAMKLAKDNNLMIVSHAEDNFYKYAPAGEYVAVKREIEMLKDINCKYHFCHISTKESFEYIREAQKEGLNVTCEVAPHHLFLNETMINNNPNFKMNPPLRSEEDRLSTIKALLDNTALMLASDHAPHTKEEKSLEYDKTPNGIIGLETMIPLVYTNLIKNGIATLTDLTNWLVTNPAKVFGLEANEIKEKKYANIIALDINNLHTYTEDEILSKGKNSPFVGMSLYGFNKLTIYKGKVVYSE